MRQIALRLLVGVAGVAALWLLLLADRPKLGPKVAGLSGAMAAVAVIFAITGSRQALGGFFGPQKQSDGKDKAGDDG